MEIKEEKKDNGMIFRIKGSIDLDTSPELRKKMLKNISDGNNILVDLSNVEYIDSSGIATFVESFQTVKSYNKKFFIFSMSAPIKSVFELARLDRVFEIYETEEKALENI